MFNLLPFNPDSAPDVLQSEALEVSQGLWAEDEAALATLSIVPAVQEGLEMQATQDEAQRSAGEMAVIGEVELEQAPEPVEPDTDQPIDINRARQEVKGAISQLRPAA